MSRKRAADPRSEHVRRRRLRTRSRFRVEALEPRWLLSTTASNPTDPDPGQRLITVSAVYRSTAPLFQAPLTDDWTTAQILPDADAVKVKGEPSPGSLPDLLEIQVGPNTWSIRFTLKSTRDDQPVAESFQLFDSQLNEYTSFQPGSTAKSFDFSLSVTSGTTPYVFVKISLPAGVGAANSDQQSPESFPYILEVTRNGFALDGKPTDGSTVGSGENGDPGSNPSYPYDGNDGGGSGGAGGGGGGGHGGEYGSRPDPIVVTLPPSSPDSSSSLPPSSVPAGPGSQSNPPAQADDPLTISVPVAVGPLPVRSAAPLGGVFASPESVPPVDRHEGARADLATFDPARHLDDAAPNPRQVVPDGELAAESVGVKVIALRGPGGLPVLATALIAGTANAGRAGSPVSAQPNADTPTAPTPTLAHFEAGSTSAEQASSSSSRMRTESSSSGRAARPKRRPSVVLGLTLAFVLGFSLVLPDLVAALQYVAPSRPPLRRRWIRRALTHG